jgi:hypothetical protein
MALREFTILVPLANNEGEPFGADVFAALESELLDLAGGFTRQEGLIGFWRSDAGRVYEDRMRGYTVALGTRNARATVIALARRWCVAFAQEAMYVRLPGGNAEIVTPEDG